MTDKTLARQLAEYAVAFSSADIPSDVQEIVKYRMIDSLACTLGAYDAPPVQAAKKMATAYPASGANVFGMSSKTTSELAAFANGVMVRYLDFNDGYMGKEPGHPSDNIPACLAVAQSVNATGAELISAIVLAYEIQMRFQDAARLNRRGWDHVNFVNISAAVAVAKLMELTVDQAEQAINLSLNGHIAMRQVRSGTLSDWKGCSAANAARNAIFAAQLAQFGMTGPAPIFEGRMGFFQQVSGEFTLDVSRFGSPENENYAIKRSLTKTFPTNGELHTAVWAAIELSQKIDDPQDIASILIETSEFNKRVLADDEKWQPRTRETADHSLPYNVARAMLDGNITLNSYAEDKLSDPALHSLIAKTTVAENSRLTALFPQQLSNKVTVELISGRVIECERHTGPGSVETPMTQSDFERKFVQSASPHLSVEAQGKVLDFVDNLDKQNSFEQLFSAMLAKKAD